MEVPSDLKSEVLNLAVTNLICSVSLTGVLALQAARWWAERSDEHEELASPATAATSAAPSAPGSGYVSGVEEAPMDAETRMKVSSGKLQEKVAHAVSQVQDKAR